MGFPNLKAKNKPGLIIFPEGFKFTSGLLQKRQTSVN